MNKNKLLLLVASISLVTVGLVTFTNIKNAAGFAQFAKASGPEKSFTFNKDTTGFTNTNKEIAIRGESYEDGYQFATGRYMDLLISFSKVTFIDQVYDFEEQLKTFDSDDNFMEGNFLEASSGDIYLEFGVNNLQSISITFGVDEDANSSWYLLEIKDGDGDYIGDGVEEGFIAGTKTTISWSTEDEYDRDGNSNDIRLVAFNFGAETMTNFYIESISLTWSC
jgi:hypothetical protein